MPKKRKHSKMYLARSTKRKYQVRDFFSIEYKAWRQSVYERDGHKCQMPGCNVVKKGIQAHHIIKWSSAPKLRFSVYNGITLCKTCHKKIDGKEELYQKIFFKIVRDTMNDKYKEKIDGQPILDISDDTELEH